MKSIPILDNNCNKISDVIHKRFADLENEFKLFNLLNYLVVNTGPGSYTSLRVGISFMLGISYSRNIPVYGLSCTDYLSSSVTSQEFYKTIILICSANNQNFICLPINKKNNKYKILQIDNDNFFKSIELGLYTKCISNTNPPTILKINIESYFGNIIYPNIKDNIKYCLSCIDSDNKNLLEPIYISKNKIFEQ